MNNRHYLRINIEVDKLLQHAYASRTNGQRYIDVTIMQKKQADNKGNTVSASVSVKKEDGTYNTIYVGNGKEYEFGNRVPLPIEGGSPVQTQYQQPAPAYQQPAPPPVYQQPTQQYAPQPQRQAQPFGDRPQRPGAPMPAQQESDDLPF